MFSVHIPFSIRHFAAVTKFLLPAALLLLPGFMADAQVKGPLAIFTEKVRTSRINFTYSYTASSLRGSGKASVQKDCFLLTMGNFEIFCDGKQMWTVDRENREAVVETVDSPDVAGSLNPALLVAHLDKAFTVKSSTPLTYKGVAAEKYVLLPSSAPADLVELTVTVAADGTAILAARAKVKDGTVTDFTFPSFKISGVSDISDFRLSESSFPGDYIITDLR